MQRYKTLTGKRRGQARFPRGVLCLIFALALSQGADAATIYFGFTHVDPATRTVTANAYVIVEGERIVTTGSGPAPQREGAEYVNMSGRYALPGFFDLHGHINGGPLKVAVEDGEVNISRQPVENITAFQALIALAFGVTTIRNPAGDPDANHRYDLKIQSGEWLGPEAIHAGFTFDPTPIEGLSVYPADEAGWDREIARQKDLGMRYIKLYTGLKEDEVARGIQIAHAHGMKTIAHLDRVSWTRAIELGIDELTHALPTSEDLLDEPARSEYIASRAAPDAKFMFRWFEMVNFDSPRVQRLIRLLAERQIPVDLTLVTSELIYFFDDPELVAKAEDARYVHPLMIENWRPTMTASHRGWTMEDYRRAHAVMPKVLEWARRLHEAGVALAIGTDGAGGSPFYARELALHVKAGIPVWDVLAMATTIGAQRLGMEHRTGQIAAGKEADIVFLEADPLADVQNVTEVHTVISDGRAYRFEELVAMTAPFAAR